MTRFGIHVLQARVKAAVDAEGLRPYARRTGVGVGVVRSILDGRDLSYSNAEALAKSVALDFGFGPAQQIAEPPSVDPEEFARVPLHAASLAAGDGAENSDESVVDHLAFRRSWLIRIGVSAPNAVLARAHGDSMAPMIHSGDMVLIDRSQRDILARQRNTKDSRPAPIYAVLDDGMARVKRIERPEPGIIILGSDNSAYPPEVLTGKKVEGLDIIGKVMWWGHTNREN